MDKRAAKREAHSVVADLIWAHLDHEDTLFLEDEPTRDEDRLRDALDELMRAHRRKAGE